MAIEPATLWDSEQDSELICIDVHQETHDVKTFTFTSKGGKRFAFAAGQYFTFDVEINGEIESRCYSISSSPHRANAISITVKRAAGGKVSNHVHDTLVAGQVLRAIGPLGGFIRPAAPKYLLLSAGSGITPLMSMARDMLDAGAPVDVVFLHAGRSPRDLIFRDELTNIAKRLKGFRLYFVPKVLTCETSWSGLNGRISKELLALCVPDIAERVVMCCGPASFMAAAQKFSTELGAARYMEESFDAAVITDAPAELVPSGERRFQVEFRKQARTIEVGAGETVLSCAKKSGIRLPSSCSNGLCGTCKSKLISGTVDMAHNGGIRQREIDAGLFLPCCSKPLSDLVIER